ncbi:hypothetical protein EE612_050002, partial [Oryza sativa]
WVSISQTYSI